jgi:hypothetical protein
MYKLSASFSCFVLAGCAATSSNVTQPGLLETIEVPKGTAVVGNVEVIDVATLTNDVECRYEGETGSRIRARRCYTADQLEAQTLVREQAQKDVDEMRRQQVQRDLARQQARDAFIQQVIQGGAR